MDLLLSILQTNSEISFKETTRLYFGQFPIKLVFDFEFVDPPCRLGNFVSVAKSHLSALGSNPSSGRIRKEGDLVTIFVDNADTAQQLIDHIDLVFNISSVDTYLTAMEFPSTQERQDHLFNDGVVRGKHFKYQYRVAVTDGLMKKHQPAVKELLNAINEDVENFHFNNNMKRRLVNFSYLYGVYYYCNDLGHITWIRLLDPKFIKKIQSVMTES